MNQKYITKKQMIEKMQRALNHLDDIIDYIPFNMPKGCKILKIADDLEDMINYLSEKKC